MSACDALSNGTQDVPGHGASLGMRLGLGALPMRKKEEYYYFYRTADLFMKISVINPPFFQKTLFLLPICITSEHRDLLVPS